MVGKEQTMVRAVQYARKGLAVFPLRPWSKVPAIEQWQTKATTDENQILAWCEHSPSVNIGIACGARSGGVFAIDVDDKDGKGGSASLEVLQARYGELPPTLMQQTPSGGRHLLFRAPDGVRVGNSVSGLGEGLDVRGDGGYVAADPSRLENGEYCLIDADDDLPEIAYAPHWLIGLVEKREQLAAVQGGISAVGRPLSREKRAYISSALDRLDPAMSRDGWIKVGMALHHESGGDWSGLELWSAWSERSHKHAQEARRVCARQWQSFSNSNGAGIEINTLYRMAHAAGWVPPVDNSMRFVDDRALPMANGAASRALPFTVGSEGFDRVLPWLVRGYIPASSFGYLYGASGSFKTFITLSLCCHVASGTDWHGAKVKGGPVVYFAAEGAHGVRRRIKAWEKVTGHKLSNLYVVPQGALLDTPDGVAQAIATLNDVAAQAGEPVALATFDTYARCLAGDENESGGAGKFVAGCDEIKRETGASVMAVHHNGKDETKGARGSNALRGAADYEYLVTRSGDTVRLSCEKQKDAEMPKPLDFVTKLIDLGIVDDEGEPVRSLVIDLQGAAIIDDSKDRAIEVLRACLSAGHRVGMSGHKVLAKVAAQLPEGVRADFGLVGDLGWLNRAIMSAYESGEVVQINNGREQRKPVSTLAPVGGFEFCGAWLMANRDGSASVAFSWSVDNCEWVDSLPALTGAALVAES